MNPYQHILSAPLPDKYYYVQYAPVVYSEAPPAPPPVAELLPNELRYTREYYRQLRHSESLQSEARLESGPKPSWTSSFKKSLKGASKTIGDEFSDVTLTESHSEGSHIAKDEAFRSHFRFPWEEQLLESFHCKVIVSPGFNRAGICYISSNYLSFISSHKHERISFMIPLREIVSFRAAIESGRKHVKQVVAAERPTETTRGLIVYSTDHLMHRFYHFSHDCRDVYNVLDHAWRMAKEFHGTLPMPVPLNVIFPDRPATYDPYSSVARAFGVQRSSLPQTIPAHATENVGATEDLARGQPVEQSLSANNVQINNEMPSTASISTVETTAPGKLEGEKVQPLINQG